MYRDFNNIDKIIEELELDYIEFVSTSIEYKKGLLPLTKKRQIKGLIWNLLSSEKYRKKISYKNYSDILDILISRISE
jgi:hypothetical protein